MTIVECLDLLCLPNGLPLTGANRTQKGTALGTPAVRLASGAAAELDDTGPANEQLLGCWFLQRRHVPGFCTFSGFPQRILEELPHRAFRELPVRDLLVQLRIVAQSVGHVLGIPHVEQDVLDADIASRGLIIRFHEVFNFCAVTAEKSENERERGFLEGCELIGIRENGRSLAYLPQTRCEPCELGLVVTSHRKSCSCRLTDPRLSGAVPPRAEADPPEG